MSIRNSSKAVILHKGKILLTKCRNSRGEIFFTLPGGGQNPYETMEDAVIRECLEETGMSVKVDRFVALHEEVITDEVYRISKPDYSHKIFHIFLCRLISEKLYEQTEIDENQIGVIWIEPTQIGQINFYPEAVGKSMMQILNQSEILYLGSTKTSETVSL